MTRIRNLLLYSVTLVVLAACGGSGSDDVTIATDDPPQGAKANSVNSGAMAADANPDRATAAAATTDRRVAASPER